VTRTSGAPNRRARTLGVILAVIGAGFAVAALASGLVFAVSDEELPWASVGVFAAVAVLTLGIAALVGWPLLEGLDAPPPPAAAPDAGDGWFDAQRRLLDDVRHELKTPITIVRGHLEVMDPTDAEDVAAIRDLGIAELDRMTRLIGDIDLLASVDSDHFTMTTVDVAALTQRVWELVSVIPDRRWSVEQTGAAMIRGDRDRLLQAWLQLADNASKYSPDGSSIEIGSAVGASGVQLWVRDHGPGIPPALRHRIFRRFDRGTGKRTVGGSGLGLAIVDTIAKSHGGHCSVTDTPGGGATFTLEIPIGTRAAVPAPVRAGDVVLQREATG
jgi:two-component system OmpR family sensor kinase